MLALTLPGVAELPATEGSGASAAFTSEDPLVVACRALVDAGDFRTAEDRLARAITAEDADPQVARAREELAEIIRRIRLDYPLDAIGMRNDVRRSVPDASDEEIDRWAGESRVRRRAIDGVERFHARSAEALFLFSHAARTRRAAAGRAPPAGWNWRPHLEAVLAEADRTGAEEVLPVRHRVTHTIEVSEGHPLVRPGSRVRAWLPFPQEYRRQRDVVLLRTDPPSAVVAPAGFDRAPQRSVFLERFVEDPARPMVFEAVYEYTTSAYCPRLEESLAEPLPPDWGEADLGERPPHIVFTPDIRRTVEEILGDHRGSGANPLIQARRIFRWISANVPWHPEDEYSTIPSFAVHAFTGRRGDCGIQNTLFITMCRIAGIPARWQSGFQTRPGGSGLHDWAEIYLAPWGWLPADASYGVQSSDDPRVADFFCGRQDAYRMVVNLDWGRQLWPPMEASLRAEPSDFQRGEVEVDGRALFFDAWRSRTVVEHDPPP